MRVPILKQGDYLIASIQSALTDADLVQLRDDLAEMAGRNRARAIIIDVTALDVMDSFAVRTLRAITHILRMRGARTVIVGIQPEVAFAMVQLGLTLGDTMTALDLEEGLALLSAGEGTTVNETRVPIHSDADIIAARHLGRKLAEQVGFSGSELTVIATAISEIARNIVEYARSGEVVLRPMNQGNRRGIIVVARDRGPGIADVELAMQDGYSTSKGIGLGLPGARRLMDEFDIDSKVGKGTTITMKKWIA